MLRAYVQRYSALKADRSIAWLDLIQGASGALLVAFMWLHLFEVSSILLGNDAMYSVTRMFEGESLFGKPFPVLVSLFGAAVLTVLVVHAAASIRRIPSSYRQYRLFRDHAAGFRHPDTSLWLLQVATGFVLMFLATAHLLQMMLNPEDIGPYASADRVWSGRWWPVYLVLLFAVELHGGIGIYRLAVKWGWFADARGRTNLRLLRRVVWSLIGFFILLGLTTLAAYMKLGYEHRHQVGERYVPAAVSPADQPGR